MKRAAVAIASCVLFGAASLGMADPVTLKINLSPGQSWTFESTQDTNSDNHAQLNGQTQPFKTGSGSRRSGKMEVLAVKDGLPTQMKVTFSDDCKNSQNMNGQAQDVPFPYAGKTVTISKQADGTVSDDFQGQADPESANELHGLLDQNIAIFPKAAVEVGQEWPGDPAAVARLMELTGPDDRAGMTMKLLAVHKESATPTADVKVSMAVARTQGGLTIKMISQGTATVDLNTGHVTKVDLLGKTDMSGTQSGPGPDGNPAQYTIDGSGKMTIAQKASGIAGGPNGVPTGGGNAPLSGGSPPMGDPGANPLGSGGANPLGGGTNPLAAPAISPFAGHFSDGKLTVDFTGPSERLNGTLSLNGQVYPATATAKGDSISGTFTAADQPYPFTATAQGDTMVLISAGQTYTLKKASLNPLAAPR